MRRGLRDGVRTAWHRGLRICALVAWCLGSAAASFAHDISVSYSRLQVDGALVRATLTFDALRLRDVDRNGDGRVSQEEIDESIEAFYADVSQHYRVSAPGAPPQVSVESYGIRDDHILDIEVVYVFDSPVSTVSVSSTFDRIARPDHRHLTSVTFDGVVQGAILDASMPDAEFRPAGRPLLDTAKQFVLLGLEHIITGFDHLAFLVVLVVASRGPWALVKVVTSFTVAHSITLALATLDFVVPPSVVTESLIALSIAYVAVENLLKERMVERHLVTFAFGLVHGFGFSGVLRDMQLPTGGLVVSLMSFNIGVELGQIAFVLLLYPFVVLATTKKPRAIPAVSAIVACLAVCWFVERTLIG